MIIRTITGRGREIRSTWVRLVLNEEEKIEVWAGYHGQAFRRREAQKAQGLQPIACLNEKNLDSMTFSCRCQFDHGNL